ncbi:beta-ketoacyl synthase N-terminal-like domain-containing protein [Chryseobacterium arthrosphaerae]|uniref:beta-ketoacyl synthase N-terminal-like domain-containing protein n=1 Tax=Chryseobacterium arthrosphaerae TaxID=651561 RepID=UPI001E485317|nr:beta-ketoacyl synthase N-terminal-like domain-containing protein [Chryseobacterium arthrosphaerae]UEQ74793.1 beta-ketoacyl synthase [Chryseobacterium arthrosphaerae]
MRKEIYITDYNCVTPLGFNVETNWKALLEGHSGVALHQIIDNQDSFYASMISTEKLDQEFNSLFEAHTDSNTTRLEKMLFLSLKPLIEKHAINEDTALILSTTKGNISLLKNQTELPDGVYLSALAQKTADFFGFKTKPIVISNACVSGVMAIAVAKNMIQAGRYKDAFVIAGDELSEFVISGFNSFQAIGSGPCQPYDKNRDGINIGEAAAAVYITSCHCEEQSDEAISQNEKFRFKVLGDSAINDANHISGPSRTGDGLYGSIRNAMTEAQVSPEQIDFVSAHGTATLYNDEMEAIAFNRMELQHVPLNSMKGYYGHCLGASGLLESIISMESALHGILIPSKNFEENGVSQPLNIIKENQPATIRYILKTASGFGGCNAAIVLEKC